jgi:hypothetical protein
MLKQANFAIYLILFGSLLSISFFFTKEISKVTTNTPLKKDMECKKTSFYFFLSRVFEKSTLEIL